MTLYVKPSELHGRPTVSNTNDASSAALGIRFSINTDRVQVKTGIADLHMATSLFRCTPENGLYIDQVRLVTAMHCIGHAGMQAEAQVCF